MKYIFSIITLLLTLMSCRSVKYVPVERVDVKTEYRDRIIERRDSILVQDSVFIALRGDTVFHDRWHVRYRERWRADTVQIVRKDSVIVPQIIEVERKATFVETLGNRLLQLICLLAALYASWYLIKRFLWRKLP